jgi:hypothetical protein
MTKNLIYSDAGFLNQSTYSPMREHWLPANSRIFVPKPDNILPRSEYPFYIYVTIIKNASAGSCDYRRGVDRVN